MNPHHTRHLDNLDAQDIERYQSAIERSGHDLSIRQGAYDVLGRMWDASRYSLWCPMLIGDLSDFWALVEQ